MDSSELDMEVDELENKIPKWDSSSDEVKQKKIVKTCNRMQEVIDCYGTKNYTQTDYKDVDRKDKEFKYGNNSFNESHDEVQKEHSLKTPNINKTVGVTNEYTQDETMMDYEVNNSEDGATECENKCSAKASRTQSTASSPQNILTPTHSFNLSFQETWEMYATNYYRYSNTNSINTNNNNNYVKTINGEPAVEKKITNNNISCDSVELAVGEDNIVEATPENLIGESRSNRVPFEEAVSTEVPNADQHTVIESNEATAEDHSTVILCTSGDYTNAVGMLVDKKTSPVNPVKQASQASSSSGSEKNTHVEVHVDVHKTLNGSLVKYKHTKKPLNFSVHKNRATVLDDLGDINSIVSETVVSLDNKVSRKCRSKNIKKVCVGGITEVLSVSDHVEKAHSSTQTEINMMDYKVNDSEGSTSDCANKRTAKASRSQSIASSPQNILPPTHNFNLSFQNTWEMYAANCYRHSNTDTRHANNNNNYVETINRELAVEEKITNINMSCDSVELAVDEDGIIEATPENLIGDFVRNVHQNRMEQGAEKSKEFNLAISLFDRQEEYDSIFEFVKHFGGVFEGKSSSVTVDTTHLIMKPYENNRIRPTLKYFKAILLHIPVVSFDWIQKSLKFGKPLPEEYFLVYGENGETAVQMSLIDEHSSLFEKTSILVLGPSNSGLTASSIEDLLIAGAAYVYKEKDFKKVPRTLFKIVLTDMRITQNMCRDHCEKFSAITLPMIWAFESITQYKLKLWQLYVSRSIRKIIIEECHLLEGPLYMSSDEE